MVVQRIQKLFHPSKFWEIFYVEKKLMRLVDLKQLDSLSHQIHYTLFLLQVAIWPGDNLINFKFLSIYVSSFFFILIPLCGYFATTDDKFYHIAIGICEMIQELVYISKIFNILLNRHELKALLEKLENGFKGGNSISSAPMSAINIRISSQRSRKIFKNIIKKLFDAVVSSSFCTSCSFRQLCLFTFTSRLLWILLNYSLDVTTWSILLF